MGSIIFDGAVIEEKSLTAAGAVVTRGITIPAGSLAMGSPAKVVRSSTVSGTMLSAALVVPAWRELQSNSNEALVALRTMNFSWRGNDLRPHVRLTI